MSTAPHTRTWADGYGLWHATVSGRTGTDTLDDLERVARAAIRAELDARGDRGPEGSRGRVRVVRLGAPDYHSVDRVKVQFVEYDAKAKRAGIYDQMERAWSRSYRLA